MKLRGISIFIGISLIVLPTAAFAYTHHCYRHCTPVSVPTPPPPVTPLPTNPPPIGTQLVLNCINYGYQPLVNGQYDMNQVGIDLAYLKAHGYNCLRLAFYGTNSALSEKLALVAKNAGFYVSIGNDGFPTSPGYADGVIAEATWAEANHIEQVSIGNEARKDKATQSALSSLSCSVRAVYGGIISYDSYLADQDQQKAGAIDDIKAWAANRGCLDRLGLNIYASYSSTLAEAQTYLPGHFYVSETNLDCDAGRCNVDATWATGLSSILSEETSYRIPIFIFSFNAGGDGVNTHWAIMGHPAVQAAIGL